MYVSYYFSDLFLNYGHERWLFERSVTASAHSGETPISGGNLIKTVLVFQFLCIEKLEKFYWLKSRKLIT